MESPLGFFLPKRTVTYPTVGFPWHDIVTGRHPSCDNTFKSFSASADEPEMTLYNVLISIASLRFLENKIMEEAKLRLSSTLGESIPTENSLEEVQ